MGIYVIAEYDDGKVERKEAENDFHARNMAYAAMFICREDGKTPTRVSIVFDFKDGKGVILYGDDDECT